jgi:hypothetical protein
MDLQTINEMWERDSKIDQLMLDQASIRIPQLHQKYLTLLSEYTLLHKKKGQDLKKLQHIKYLYYAGKAPPEDYEENPFPHKVLKSDVYSWVSVDEDIHKVELKLDYYAVVLRTLEEILKQVHQMSYNIKNVIQWRQFAGGV